MNMWHYVAEEAELPVRQKHAVTLLRYHGMRLGVMDWQTSHDSLSIHLVRCRSVQTHVNNNNVVRIDRARSG
jgi:hypothetical protein